MSFEDEWAEHEKAAAERSMSMRLNQLPASGGGGGSRGDLSITQRAQTKAAQHLEDPLGPAVKKAANIADTGSAAVSGSRNAPGVMSPGGLAGWETKDGLLHCVEEWERQAKNLVNRLAAEITALREADLIYTENEEFTASQFGGVKIEGQSPNSKIADL